MRKITLVFVFLLAVSLLAACGPASATELQGADKDAVLAYAEPMTDNLLTAINEGNFANFSRDFDTGMAKAMNEKAFNDIENGIVGKIGKYVSRTVTKVESSGKYRTVIYTAEFEQDSPVTVRLVFNTDENNKVSGLWFDSAKLRQ
jgi:hypothetical protein